MKVRKSNCFFFALRLYYRRLRKKKTGYLISRRSHYGWFPHFMYVRVRRNKKLQVVGYVPKDPKLKTCPPPIFDGKVKWGETQFNDTEQ